MNDAVEILCVKKELRLGRTPVRPRCCDRDYGGKGPIPARAPGGFVVDLLSPTGPLDREEAGLLLSWFEWVEVEAGEADLLEGIARLRGAVMKAAAGGRLFRDEDAEESPVFIKGSTSF